MLATMHMTLGVADITTLARANLQAHAEQARGAFAPNTARALKADVAIFMAWCRSADCTPMPADPDTVARFIDEIGEQKAPATVRRYVSSLSTFHRAARVANPVEAQAVKLALKRLHRAKGRAQAQAAPLNRPIVERLLAAVPNTLLGLRNRALLAVAYDTLARRSELVALLVEDIEAGADGAATILIRRSKVDQEGMGDIRYLAPDTLRHLRAWLAGAGVTSGPIFRGVAKGGRVAGALSAAAVAEIFKAMATAAGVSVADAARISGHSSRVGAAQDMARHGLELPSIMQAGGWRTATMVARYTARLDARRSGAAKLAVLQDRG
jgi:integrase